MYTQSLLCRLLKDRVGILQTVTPCTTAPQTRSPFHSRLLTVHSDAKSFSFAFRGSSTPPKPQVFGVLVAASPGVAPETLRHAASILAEFLDQVRCEDFGPLLCDVWATAGNEAAQKRLTGGWSPIAFDLDGSALGRE